MRDDLSLNNFAKIETQYALGIETIVTGVETAAQLAKLNALECQYGQDYFFAKPINQDAVGTLISSQLQPVRSVDN